MSTIFPKIPVLSLVTQSLVTHNECIQLLRVVKTWQNDFPTFNLTFDPGGAELIETPSSLVTSKP